jgi:uncharacterized protein (DUF927 family)
MIERLLPAKGLRGCGKRHGRARPRATNPKQTAPRQVRPRTAEDIANEQTAEQLALRIWAAMVGQKVLSCMSALFDELIEEKSHLLDDDDEEQDESFIDDHRKREKKVLDEGIAYGLNKYPDINSISKLLPSSDPDVVRDVDQLKAILTKCAVGVTRFEEKFSREQLERMVRRDLKTRFEKDKKYRTHVREDVPGADVTTYGSLGRTSSRGTFAKADDFVNGGGLTALRTGGWLRVAKDRIEPVALSYEFGPERKSERQSWRHCFRITERSGHRSSLDIPREKLAGTGGAAIKLLMKSRVHIIRRDVAVKALVRFLAFKPRKEIVRMPRPGWAEIDGSWVFVRPDEVITPPGMPKARNTIYMLDPAATRYHGLHIVGTVGEWAAEVAAPLRGNSNVALSFGTFFAAPLLCFASEPGGGNHLHGPSTIGKTMVSDAGQSIYGWHHETADDAFGVSWGGTEAGFDALALAHTDLGLPLDEITLSDRRTAEQVVYKLASGTKGPRATPTGQLRETAHASVLVLSTGEKSLAQFIGRSLQEGACKRLVDVPAQVRPGSAFEKISREQIHIEGKRLFEAMKQQHGAVGRAWQQHLVDLGPDKIKAQLNKHREAFLKLPQVIVLADKAHPQVRAVVNRFALYAAALHMVINAGLLPWTIEEADADIVACMERWVEQRGNADTAGELLRAAREIEREIAAGLTDRFIHIRKAGKRWAPVTEADKIKQKTPRCFDGYVKQDHVLIRPAAWRRLCNGFDPAEIARHFRQQGTLLVDHRGGKLSKSEQVIGRVERFYVLSRASLTR